MRKGTTISGLLKKMRDAAAAGAVAFLAFLPASVLAAAPDLGLQFGTEIGLTTTDIRTTVSRIISYFLGLLGILAVGLVLYAGFLWMTAAGNEEKVSTAKKILVNAVIGLVIIMSAFAITQFVFRSIDAGFGGGAISSNGCTGGAASCCPPGQVCSTGLGGGGGAGGFRIEGITPAGAGQSNGGWPKNYAITVHFNAPVSEASATPSSVEVRKCNPRMDGDAAASYRGSSCGTPIAGSLTVDGGRIVFRPTGTSEAEATDFDGDFWYRIRLQGGSIRDTQGRMLTCPLQTEDISSPTAAASYCERAMAFSNVRDTQPPTVTLDAPASPPAYCASPTAHTAQIVATGADDVFVAGIDFLLDGGSANLVNESGAPTVTAVNAGGVSPFAASSVYVDLTSLTAGLHRVSAVARDGVPQSSSTAERAFSVVAPHCCNAVRDESSGETAIDCGGECGACAGGSCTTGSDCASGSCQSGRCVVVPVIQSLSAYAGGPGTLVTVSGTGFGTSGSVAFLGADTDGNGDAAGDADDVTVQACAPQAWTDTSVVVAVPSNAVSGPVRITTGAGSDRTDDTAQPPRLPNFVINASTHPGICYLAPRRGGIGSRVSVNGSGFGASVAAGSVVMFGSYPATVTTCDSGASDCGWSDTRVWVTVPSIPDADYPVRVTVDAASSNPSNFQLESAGVTGEPRVTAVIPASAPPGSYVTIQGTNFGNRKGVVKFLQGTDSAIAEETVCADNWHNSYIVVKVPSKYQGGLDLNASAGGVAHGIQVQAASPAKTSNTDVTFGVTTGAARPGVCSISPDNGPPGNAVTVKGEGFGSPDIAAVGGTTSPRFSVDFFKSAGRHCLFSPGTACTELGAACPGNGGTCVPDTVPSSLYALWEDTTIGTVVAGNLGDAANSPRTGPVYVIANNMLSVNAVPFTVSDCRAAGASCAAGTTCCGNGSCQANCQSAAKTSAYGWQFSTSVLPSLPRVVERSICSASPSVMQSPSPGHDDQNACKNAQFFVEFTAAMDTAAFNATTVKVEECGSGAAADCAAAVAVPLKTLTAANFSGCDSLNTGWCRMFQAQPAANYEGGYWKKGAWYRVTLVSDPTASIGLKEGGSEGKYLDGDVDKRQGGDYVTMFRARNSDDPCQISSVQVIPGRHTIGQDQDAVGFNAGLLAGNCNLLQCGTDQPYAISWQMTPQYLTNVSTLNAGCTQNVLARGETPPGLPTPLTASVTPLPSGSNPSKSGKSDVTIKFADPRVVESRPRAECSMACINAAIGATFNLPMNPQTLNDNNVQLLRCRNASCSAPFMPDLGNGITATVSAAPFDPPTAGSNVSIYKNVTIRTSGNLLPNTFYLVRVKGGLNGVKSRSGAALAGLNNGEYYSWKFRTKEDASSCAVSRTALEPQNAVLRYVGDRAGLSSVAYGSPDECASGGQQLDATSYNWLWTFDAPNRILQGFVNGAPQFLPPERRTSPTTLVDTVAKPKQGCSANCILAGSQTARPQCGDGRVNAKFEECDDGNTVDNDACRNTCVLSGTAAPSCGNGTVGAGESCDTVGGVWPPGCKQPGVQVDGFPLNLGCVFTGSVTAGGSSCGDTLIGDGESCDDGNTADGDGCSSSCLKEGTLRSCLGALPGEPCMDMCGNGRVEPGEDASCEPNPSGANCDVNTCLKKGTLKCSGSSTGASCCGNGTVDRGEDAGCDTPNGVSEFCSNKCLLNGSSAFYTAPSFCGDGIVGAGEQVACESTAGDQKLDPYQAVVANVQTGFDATGTTPNMSVVKATITGVTDAQSGRATLALNCSCKSEPAGSQDAFCQNIHSAAGGGAGPFTDNLACADNGCCMPRPTVVRTESTSFNACRNVEVVIVFSEVMKADTITPNLLVGYANGTSACPTGTSEVPPLAFAEGGSLWSRVWNGVASFIRNVIIRPVFGVTSGSTAYQNERYCAVSGSVAIRIDGAGTDRKTVMTFAPTRAFPANKHIRIRLNPGVKSLSGVPLLSADAGAAGGYQAYFATGSDICAINRVEVSPPSVLLSSLADEQSVVVRALSASGQSIVPTLDYGWGWSWDAQPTTSPLVIVPRMTNSTMCGLGTSCTNAAGCPCFRESTTALCTVPNGQDSCTSNVSKMTSVADLRVRGSSPVDGNYVAKNSKGSLPINANAVIANECVLDAACTVAAGCPCSATPSGSCTVANGRLSCALPTGTGVATISSQETTGTAKAVVLLCSNPWPKYQPCTGTSCTSDIWTPFHDSFSNVEFYYCRDQQNAGDGEAETLPCLKETPASVLSPAAGILREYLFTFETNVANCPNGPLSTGKWQSDAFGMRVASNGTHASIRDWYESRGFRGTPTSTLIDGYEALTEGRTAYVSAASKTAGTTGTNSLYTNAYVLSYSDGAQPETTAIFNQILGNIDFNSNPELVNMGVCRQGTARSGAMLKCAADADCRVDAAGKTVPGRETFTCRVDTGRCMNGAVEVPEAGNPISCDSDLDCQLDAPVTGTGSRVVTCDVPKSKLRRDVKRWADLMTLRDDLNQRQASAGTYPTLDAGTFLRSQTNSSWSSWNEALGTPNGLTLPTDPLNLHASCALPNTSYDPKTCWDAAARQYICPVGSHVYDYKSVGGADFVLRNDLEFTGTGINWGGSTCLEKSTLASCIADPLCGGTCSANSPNKGQSCSTNADCGAGGSCGVPCNYRKGKIIFGTGVAPFSGQNCSGVPQSTATGGNCGDGVLNGSEVCEIGQTSSLSCDGDAGTGTRAGSAPQLCNNSCSGWVNLGRCSQASPRAGSDCVSSADCGTGGTCINWTDFKCVGGANNGRACTSNASCTGGSCASICIGGACGDGVVQFPEKCDDGPLNGTYGHCQANCGGVGLACGDGKRQPNEACDCRELNGQYVFNGIASTILDVTAGSSRCAASGSTTANGASCSWDCSGAGPRCGDGVVNGAAEQCDGGFEEFRGVCGGASALSSPSSIGCNTNADCPSGVTCGNFCATVEQKQRRACNPNSASSTTDDTNACKWSSWVCTAPGTCGNGKTETGEQCDDGNANNTDACIIDPTVPNRRAMCQTARCGDGFVHAAGGEECDDGSGNGKMCSPEYGLTCNYCNASCRLATVSGNFCGDLFLHDDRANPPGPEQCDNTLGLTNDWVCVSQRPENMAYGLITGPVGCGSKSCLRACEDPDSIPCKNEGVNTEWDSTGQREICSNTPSGALRDWCNKLWNDSKGYFSPKVNPFGIILPLNYAMPTGGIKNSCDMDDDNDGVPDALDCKPQDPKVHGAYNIPTPNGTINIPAAKEICGDGLDNDCNNYADNIYTITGAVKDGQTGTGISNAEVVASCGTKIIATANAAENGTYNLAIQDDPGSLPSSCNKLITIVVLPEKDANGNFLTCFDPLTQGVTVDLSSTTRCASTAAPDLYVINAPPEGTYTSVLTWKPRTGNLTSHMRIVHNNETNGMAACEYKEDKGADGRHIQGCAPDNEKMCFNTGVLAACSTATTKSRYCVGPGGNFENKKCSENSECSSNICACAAVDNGHGLLDVDSDDGVKPETTTLVLRARAAYNYYVNSSNSARTQPKVHLWGPHCTDHRFYDGSKAEGSGAWWRVFNIRTNAAGTVTIKGGDKNDCSSGKEGCDESTAGEELNGVLREDAGPTPNCPA